MRSPKPLAVAVACLIPLAVGVAESAPAAGPITITDTTPTSATCDGAIGVGEYVGSSIGINSGFGNVVGYNSQLFVDSAGDGTLNFGLRSGGGQLNDWAVIYIDTGVGGFATTANFTDIADLARQAISGFDGTNRSRLDFGTGFRPSHAIVIETAFGSLLSLVENGAHNFLRSVDLTPTGDAAAGEWEVQLNLSDLGLAPGATFRYVMTYLASEVAYRSDEFHGVAQTTVPPGNPGYLPTTLGASDFNTFVSTSPEADVSADVTIASVIQPVRPNPFTNSTRISFTLRGGGPVTLEVFNVLGQRVTRLVDGTLAAGRHVVDWNGRDGLGREVAAGMYYVSMRSPDLIATRTLVKLR